MGDLTLHISEFLDTFALHSALRLCKSHQRKTIGSRVTFTIQEASLVELACLESVGSSSLGVDRYNFTKIFTTDGCSSRQSSEVSITIASSYLWARAYHIACQVALGFKFTCLHHEGLPSYLVRNLLQCWEDFVHVQSVSDAARSNRSLLYC